MENASKALIIAGGVLISIIIISLLVTFFTNIRNLRQAELTEDTTMQYVEFNKEYEVYNRKVYGSEILSLADKVEDYNIREADSKSYQEISVEVLVSTDIDSVYFPKTTYLIKRESDKNVRNDFQIAIDKLDADIKAVQDTEVGKDGHRKIYLSEIASLRNSDIEEQYNEKVDLNKEVTVRINGKNEKMKVSALKIKYNDLKGTLTRFKSTQFKPLGFEYDKNNGRVTKMKYESIKK